MKEQHIETIDDRKEIFRGFYTGVERIIGVPGGGGARSGAGRVKDKKFAHEFRLAGLECCRWGVYIPLSRLLDLALAFTN